MSRKAVFYALALVLLVAGAVLVRGRPASVAELSQAPRQIVAGPYGLLWIEAPTGAPPGPARLQYLPVGDSRPTSLLQAHDIRSIAVSDATLYVLAETGAAQDAGIMLAVDLSTGTRRLSQEGLQHPQGLVVDGGVVYWTESREARAEGIVHVPIVKPVNAIRAGAQPAGARLVGLTEGSEPHFTGALLGVRESRLYWSEHLGWEYVGGATLVKRGGADGGDPELLARTNGRNVAALHGDLLYWTRYSRELAGPSSGRLVNRTNLSTSETATLTDWLDSDGALVVPNGTPLYVDGSYVWRVPPQLDPPVPLRAVSGSRPPAVAVYGHNLYMAQRRGEAFAITRLPLGLRGYLRAALPLGRVRAKVGPIGLAAGSRFAVATTDGGETR